VPGSAVIECGYLLVPEQRAEANSRTVRLAVATVRSQGAAPAPDPIVFLAGGPGEHALAVLSLSYESWFEPFLRDRDVIVIDQRGAGYSEPALDCPEVSEAEHDAFDEFLPPEEARARAVAVVAACSGRLESGGVNLAAFRSQESAADLDDLRRALGYEQWNLYGVSYGTRLAQTIMRDHPAGLRSVVLDSSYPLDADIYAEGPANLDGAFRVFFEGCRAHPECGSVYPNLEAVFDGLVASLNVAPASLTQINPLNGETFSNYQLTGDGLAGFLFQALYSEEITAVAPRIIASADDGDYGPLEIALGIFIANEGFLSNGMHFSFQCADEVPFSSLEETRAQALVYPLLTGLYQRSAFGGEGVFDACDGWDVPPATALEDEALNSDIPTLVLAGQYDPITPPAWGREVANGLANSYFFELPGLGHGVVLGNECGLSLALAFYAEPTLAPDASCIAGLIGPDFSTS
jgi:pimeloyl-ACP methyl ester carboxylesterase